MLIMNYKKIISLTVLILSMILSLLIGVPYQLEKALIKAEGGEEI